MERGVLPLEGLHVSRSLRRSARDFEIRVDSAFDDVVGPWRLLCPGQNGPAWSAKNRLLLAELLAELLRRGHRRHHPDIGHRRRASGPSARTDGAEPDG